MQISKESATGVTPFQLTTLVTSRLPSLRVLVTVAVALEPSSGTVVSGHDCGPLGLAGLGNGVAARDQG